MLKELLLIDFALEIITFAIFIVLIILQNFIGCEKVLVYVMTILTWEMAFLIIFSGLIFAKIIFKLI